MTSHHRTGESGHRQPISVLSSGQFSYQHAYEDNRPGRSHRPALSCARVQVNSGWHLPRAMVRTHAHWPAQGVTMMTQSAALKRCMSRLRAGERQYSRVRAEEVDLPEQAIRHEGTTTTAERLILRIDGDDAGCRALQGDSLAVGCDGVDDLVIADGGCSRSEKTIRFSERDEYPGGCTQGEPAVSQVDNSELLSRANRRAAGAGRRPRSPWSQAGRFRPARRFAVPPAPRNAPGEWHPAR